MILVSACLLGENCRYDGSNKQNDRLIQFLEGKKYLPVCPEVLGGSEIPRCPAERREDRIVQKDGTDVTENFMAGCEKIFKIIENDEVEYAILQPKSPSCGVHQIYDGTFSATLTKGKGYFAQQLTERKIPIYDIENFFTDKGTI